MSGWTLVKEGDVLLEHSSTSSQVKITIRTTNEQIDWGKYEDVEEEVWLSYSQFEDLRNAINKIKT